MHRTHTSEPDPRLRGPWGTSLDTSDLSRPGASHPGRTLRRGAARPGTRRGTGPGAVRGVGRGVAEPPAETPAPTPPPRGLTTLIVACAALVGVVGGTATGYAIQAERKRPAPRALSRRTWPTRRRPCRRASGRAAPGQARHGVKRTGICEVAGGEAEGVHEDPSSGVLGLGNPTVDNCSRRAATRGVHRVQPALHRFPGERHPPGRRGQLAGQRQRAHRGAARAVRPGPLAEPRPSP